jgi:hypothetical protein
MSSSELSRSSEGRSADVSLLRKAVFHVVALFPKHYMYIRHSHTDRAKVAQHCRYFECSMGSLDSTTTTLAVGELVFTAASSGEARLLDTLPFTRQQNEPLRLRHK